MRDAGKVCLLQGRSGSQLVHVCKRPLDGTREVSQQENPSSAQRTEMPESEPSMPPALGKPCKDIPGFKWYCPMKEQAAEVCQTWPGGLPGVSSASAFPLKLGPRCWELPGCTQSMTKSWDKRGTCKAALPHMGLPQGPNMSPPEPPGQEGNLQGSPSPRGCPRGPVCPFLPSVLLLLGFLLIFRNDNI